MFESINFRSITIGIAVLLGTAACSKDDFKNSGGSEKRKIYNTIQTEATTTSADAAPFAVTLYEMTVKANTGLELCKGAVKLIFGTSLEMNASGSLTCLQFGTIDAAKIFGGGNPKVPMETVDMSQFKSHGMVVRKANPVSLAPGLTKFNPPKPMLLGPIIQNADSFNNFVFRESSQVSGITADGQPYQDTGEWYIAVDSVNQPFEPEGYTGDIKFPSTMQWHINATGFKNSPRASFMGFDSMTFWYNTKPEISVPKIEVKAKLADLAAAMGTGGGNNSAIGSMGDVLFSGVTITLIVRQHTPL